jgi:hypothetical protein
VAYLCIFCRVGLFFFSYLPAAWGVSSKEETSELSEEFG